MATDAAILTAARNLSAAMEALKAADAEVIRLGHEQKRAGEIRDEKYKAAKECETRLVQLSAQKPAEPAAKPTEMPLKAVIEVPASAMKGPIAISDDHPAMASAGRVPAGPVPNLSRKR